MKKILSTMAAIAALGIACSPAMAGDPVTKQLSISGSVNTSVSIPNDPVAIEGTNNNSTFNSGSISINSLAATDLTPQSASITVKYAGISTNSSTILTLSSTNQGLLNDTQDSVPSGFTKKVNYTAVASQDGGGDVTTLNTDTTNSADSDELAVFSDNILINITVPNTSSTDKLLPGDYSDTLTLTITPTS